MEEECTISRNKRLEDILEMLREAQYATVTQLSKKLYISPSSIRRDLDALEKRGLVKRTHGGVRLNHTVNPDIPFVNRLKINTSSKKIMASKAVALINPGDVVFVDSSTTCFYLIHEIAKLTDITIITNGIYAAQYLLNYDLDVICTGGKLDPVERTSMVGPTALETIQGIHADYTFFAPGAIDEKGICYDCWQDINTVCQCMLEHSTKKVMLCDSQKIGKTSTFKECTLGDVDILICDIPLEHKYGKLFPQVEFL